MEKLDTVENFGEIPVLAQPYSTLAKPKLKRLKKVTSPLLQQKLMDAPVIDSLGMLISPAAIDLSEIKMNSSSAKAKSGIYLDPLFTYQSVEENRGVLSMAGREESESRSSGEKEEMPVLESKEKTVKRRLNLEDAENSNENRKKKRRSKKLDGQGGKPKESIREQRKLEKAREAELEHLHAESQKLLRETRDASFKPVRLFQKPISSVLEKIRLRKMEMLKRHSIHSWMPVGSDCPDMSACSSDPLSNQNELKEIDANAKASDVGSKKSHQNITSDLKIDIGIRKGDNSLLNSLESSPPVDPPTSSSSSEEESDKENVGPSACKFVGMNLSRKIGLARDFLDDEAEEEDDSDGERMRNQESDEENESDEFEELDDLIATGNVEAPIDQEKRNELHQKWLEQQDTTETENVLQRLKYRQGHGRLPFNEGDSDSYKGSDDDDDNEVNGDCDDEAGDEVSYDGHTLCTAQGLKKAKQMISHMFTDANDVYIPSDDEETERNYIRQNMLKQNEEPSIISPVEDENSRDFFGLIKKLNIAPTIKKRGNASTYLFDALVASGNSNSSSKSSFLNRTSNSLPSSYKQGSSSVKTFIFGRDDSNSRSNVSSTDVNSDMEPNGSNTANNAVTNSSINSSQLKSSKNKRKVQADSETRSSLFNILRQSSIKFESKGFTGNHVVTESQAAYKFSAFKLRRT